MILGLTNSSLEIPGKDVVPEPPGWTGWLGYENFSMQQAAYISLINQIRDNFTSLNS
jgi:hypothetical protein